MSDSNYSHMINELKKLKKLLIEIYGKSHITVKEIDRIFSRYYGIEMYIKPKKGLNLLILGEISTNFNQSFLKQLFPMGISEIFLKRCENGINKVVFNNVSTYDQIYIALEKETMLSEEKRLFLDNVFEMMNLDIKLIPEKEENLYFLENNMGLLNFNNHMESIMFGDFNEKFAVFYENFLIEKLFITKNFGAVQGKLSNPVNKILWIPNANVCSNNQDDWGDITRFIEDILGLNFYTFVCDYSGEKFIPTIVEKNNQNLIQRIGEDKRGITNALIANNCFFDDRIEFKKGTELVLDFLTEESDGKFRFRKENSFDIACDESVVDKHFFNEDNDKILLEVERYLKKDISELNLNAEKYKNTMIKADEKTNEQKILDVFDFFKSIVIIVTDLFDESADRKDIFSDLKQYLFEFESENTFKLLELDALNELEVFLSEDNLYKTLEKVLELQKRVFKLFEEIILRSKFKIKSIQNEQKEQKSKVENSTVAVEALFEYIKSFVINE